VAGREVNTVNEGMEGGETIGVAVMLAHQSRRRLSAFSTTTPRINLSPAPTLANCLWQRWLTNDDTANTTPVTCSERIGPRFVNEA